MATTRNYQRNRQEICRRKRERYAAVEKLAFRLLQTELYPIMWEETNKATRDRYREKAKAQLSA